MNQQPELIAMDLDGTLIDSAPDLSFAIEQMLSRLEKPGVTSEQVRSWIGNGVNMLVKRALMGRMDPPEEPQDFQRALHVFSEIYEQNISGRGTLYPGVLDGLRELKSEGYVLACLTNKHSRFTYSLLDKAGLSDFFDFVVCGDTYEQRKPHPMPLLKTAERFNADPAASVMVGDSMNDIKAAKAAGFRAVCVPYGYIGKYSVDELDADHVVNSLTELPALFDQAA